MAGGTESAHERAATAFAEAISDRLGEAVASVIVFGSAARGEARGRESDVDVMVIVDDDADLRSAEATLHEAAYEALLEHGIVVATHLLTTSQYESGRDHPFLRHVRREGRVYG